MEPLAFSQPVVVCLTEERDIPIVVQCGLGLARLSGASLYLVSLVIMPPQRPLGVLSEGEERVANALLDVAANQVAASGVAATEEICVARKWSEAIQQLAEDLHASAVIVGWQTSGPFGLFDSGRALLKTVPCPIIMVGSGTGRWLRGSWPSSWLSQM